MDETDVVKKFQRIRVLTIEQVVETLKSSVITARRHLKKWRAYTSFNHNGRYYTLPGIPQFDQNGIWKYQTILFSKYGNLKQTIIQLISQSDKGLSAKEVAQVVKIPSNSSVVSQLQNVPGIRREKHQGRFIYFSGEHETYEKQKGVLYRPEKVKLPSDAEAVHILVEYIKHPDIGIDELAKSASQQGNVIDPAVIRNFLEYHDLLKKTLATG
jgi:predicted Zn-ribbon and HTH transcriptional regulator